MKRLLLLLALASCAHAPEKMSFDEAEQEQFPPQYRRAALEPQLAMYRPEHFLPPLALTAWPGSTGLAGNANCNNPSAACTTASLTTGVITASASSSWTNGATITMSGGGTGNSVTGYIKCGNSTGDQCAISNQIGDAAATATSGAFHLNHGNGALGATKELFGVYNNNTVEIRVLANGDTTIVGQLSVTGGSGNVIITSDSVYAVAFRQKSGVTNAPVKLLSESTDGASAVAGATDTTTAWSTVGAKLHSFRTNGVEKAAVTVNGAMNPDFTDDSGTTGNRTVNKPAGINAFAAAGTAITITNSVVKATSLVYAQLQAADATCTFIKSVVPAAGSFTATVNAGCTGTTKIGWIVFNGN